MGDTASNHQIVMQTLEDSSRLPTLMKKRFPKIWPRLLREGDISLAHGALAILESAAILQATEGPPTKEQVSVAILQATEEPPTKEQVSAAILQATEEPPTKEQVSVSILQATEEPPTKEQVSVAKEER